MSHPFFGEEFQFTQPDGSTITVKGWGDQQHAVFETPDGRRVRKDAAGWFSVEPISNVAAAERTAPESLRSPATAAADDAGAKIALGSQPGLPSRGTRWQQRRTERILAMQAIRAGAVLPAPPRRSTVGAFVGLCLLIEFPDVPATIPEGEVHAFCNQPGYTGFGNNGSVAEYFRDVSGGRVEYTNLVAPYYRARRPRAYYTDPTKAQPIRTVELIQEALDQLLRDRFDTSTLSTDPQGFIYALNVFYAGERVNNWAQGLWPHAYHLDHSYRLRPGASVYDYQISNMGHELTLGTFCHENGHMLCDFPDLYDYGGESNGVGVFCLMCAGGNLNPKNPAHVGAYLKHSAGWTEDVLSLTPGTTVTLRAGHNEFAIVNKSATEYLIIETRQQRGRDVDLPDAGLAVWHVDELGDNSNEQMSPTLHYECTLIQADAKSHLERRVNGGDAGDLFHAGHNDVFGHSSTPPSRWWDGTPSSVELFDIGAAGASITFSVR